MNKKYYHVNYSGYLSSGESMHGASAISMHPYKWFSKVSRGKNINVPAFVIPGMSYDGCVITGFEWFEISEEEFMLYQEMKKIGERQNER